MSRENYNPDALFIGEFKGLATAGGSFGADPSYLQTLTNAYVTKDGRLKQRSGSSFLYALSSATPPELYQFTFAGERFILHRTGASFSVYRVTLDNNGQPLNVTLVAFKASVLRDESAGEPATYAVKTEGNYCHVLIATASTQLVSITLTYRDTNVSSVTATTAVGNIGQWFVTSIAQSNSKVVYNNSVSNTTAISNSGNVLTLTWASRPPDVVVGTKLRVFSCFWLRYLDANYYQGAQLFSTGLRLNTVPLDVNVQVPDSLATNAIYNEPLQDLDYETYWVYDSNVSAAARLSKVANRQPLVNNQWDFADGSYRAINTQLTTRTPNYIAFGGLLSNNVSNRVYINRLRTILVGAFEYPTLTDMRAYVDKSLNLFVSWHLFNVNQVSSGEPKYFSFAATSGSPPGVNQESVVELVYLWNATNTVNGLANQAMVDISQSLDSHIIADSLGVPLYGYNLLARTKSYSFPNVVRFVGNRLVLTGNTNQILVSDSDWSYRGFSFTNCQVSSLNFSPTSPYLLQLEQSGGNVRAVESVNGVMVVVSDSATYRVSGKERNSPPNAETAIVSRLTNQICNSSCLTVAENSVYMANELGFYKLNYIREQDEGVLEDIGLPVANLFNERPSALVYSRAMNCLLLKFPSQRKLLAYNLLTKTYSQVHVSVPYDTLLFPTLDGYLFTNGATQVVGVWNRYTNVDLLNVEALALFTLAANELNVASAPTSADNLSISPHLAQRYSGSFVALPAYNNQIRAVGSAFVLTEQPSGNVAKAIFSSAVTKAIYSDKFSRGLRLRDVSVMLSGVGTASVVVADAGLENANQRLPLYLLTIDSAGRTTVTGEQNKASNNLAYPSGDTAIVRLGNFGLSEAYAVAVQLSPNIECVGFALNTSARALGRSST